MCQFYEYYYLCFSNLAPPFRVPSSLHSIVAAVGLGNRQDHCASTIDLILDHVMFTYLCIRPCIWLRLALLILDIIIISSFV